MSIIVALFWSLVHSLWQGLLLQAAAWLLLRQVRSAPQRYALSCAAQLGCVLAFGATLLRELGAAQAAASPLVAMPSAPAAAGALGLLMQVSVGAWGAGLLFMMARLARSYGAVRRLRASASPLLGWQPALEQWAARLGLRRAVRILEAGVDSPLALGWLEPLVLLPIGWAAQLPPHVVEAAIVHELMHLRRHDYLLNVFQHVVEALFFFHPSVWWLSRQVRVQRELCCDQAVVDAHLDPLDYAAALLALEQQRGLASLTAGGALGLAAVRGELSARVEHVLSRRDVRRGSPRRGLGTAVTALGVGVAVALGACLSGEDELGPEARALAPLEAPAPSVGPRWLPDSVSRFGSAIEVAAAAHGVDPALVSLVVLLESRGDPDVQSPGGAVGLMQLMPSTAAQLAAERGLPLPTPLQLRDPAYNLDTGAYLLAQLLGPSNGPLSAEQVRLAAIGYNGGSQLLLEHLAGRAALYPETARYSQLLSQLWAERDAESSATYQALVQP